MKKKILFTLSYMEIGGQEKAFLNLIENISQAEYEVTLLLMEKRGGLMQYIPKWVNVVFADNYNQVKEEIMQSPLSIVVRSLKRGKMYTAIGLFLAHLWYKITDNRTMYYRFALRNQKKLGDYDIAVAFAGPVDFLTVYIL